MESIKLQRNLKVNIPVKSIQLTKIKATSQRNDVASFFAVQLLLLDKHGILKSLRSIVGQHLTKQNANKC